MRAVQTVIERHRYRKDPGREGMCECGQGRSEDVHNLMTWHKSPGIGFWYSGVVLGLDVTYRIRTRLGTSFWWPDVTGLDVEDWVSIGDGMAVPLAEAKLMCEAHREAAEGERS